MAIIMASGCGQWTLQAFAAHAALRWIVCEESMEVLDTAVNAILAQD